MPDAARPLVAGAPRSGYTLLLSILSKLRVLRPQTAPLAEVVARAVESAIGRLPMQALLRSLAEAAGDHEVVSNPAFETLLGGPLAIDPARPDKVVCRKYLGVAGLGDVTFLTSHPAELIFTLDIPHSHENPALFANDPRFDALVKFASLRHPAGILVSAAHSINALASAYLQAHGPDTAEGLARVRRELALSKLSDPEVFNGLALHLLGWMEEFAGCRERYAVMRWEELLAEPRQVIVSLGRSLGMEVPGDFADAVWADMCSTNLTGTHRHNFFQGKPGFWRQCLTPWHVSALRELGFAPVMRELGFAPLEEPDKADLTPLQRHLGDLIESSRKHSPDLPEDLTVFAFNKTNLRIQRPGFTSHPWRENTRAERSTLRDARLLETAWVSLEQTTAAVNAVFEAVLALDWESPEDALKALDGHDSLHALSALEGCADAARQVQQAARRAAFERAPRREPRLVMARSGRNIVLAGDAYHAIPQSLGALDLNTIDPAGLQGVLSAHTLEEVLALVERDALPPQEPPRLVASESGVNFVAFGGMYLAIPQALGPMDLTATDVSSMPGVLIGPSLDELLQTVRNHSPERS